MWGVEGWSHYIREALQNDHKLWPRFLSELKKTEQNPVCWDGWRAHTCVVRSTRSHTHSYTHIKPVSRLIDGSSQQERQCKNRTYQNLKQAPREFITAETDDDIVLIISSIKCKALLNTRDRERSKSSDSVPITKSAASLERRLLREHWNYT